MPETFTPTERELLRLVLNRLVPAGGGFPAAGDLGVGAYLEQVAGGTAGARRLFVEGLREIAMAGERHHPDGFAALTGDQQDSVLQHLEREQPGFFEILVRQTYSGYYSHATLLRLLGVDGPPQPSGYPVDPFECNLTERVRRSPFAYRQA
jgi:Gluconate 2-dehydrogenase subunit 3